MPTRRVFLAAAGLAWGQPRPKLAFVRMVNDGVIFRRAYSACPDAGTKPLLTGAFPHSYGSMGPEPLTRFFEVVQTAGPDTILVAAGASGTGWAEREVRFALAIRFPGKWQGGITSDILISSVDVLPTVMGLAGMALPEGIHGRDLSGMLENGPPSVYSEGQLRKPGEWRMIVRGYDKMVTDATLAPMHLYNLSDDPEEQTDLAHEPGHRLRVDELRALMLDWRKRTGDGMDRSGLKRRK